MVPAELRKQLRIGTGDVLVARAEGGTLVFEPREVVVERLRDRFAHVPASVNLADALIAERRAEAEREGA